MIIDYQLSLYPNFREVEDSKIAPQIMPEKFPEVQGGGSLILAWQVKSKRVLVVGGGEVFFERLHQR